MEKWLQKIKLGAVCGDVVGSVYERFNIKRKLALREFIKPWSGFTDDTVMTCAVGRGLMYGMCALVEDWTEEPYGEMILTEYVRDAIVEFGQKYPNAGYGRSFMNWLDTQEHLPYNSWGNGSAMRASFPGWFARSLEEAERLAEISAKVTHNHPDGVKGAQAVAGSIYLLRTGQDKAAVRDYVSKFYDLNFTIDEIRDSYRFDVSCAGSVPQAVVAFLEEDTFANVIANAISLGGDSDTIAAIAGSLAEVIYPIPRDLRQAVIGKLDDFLLQTLMEVEGFLETIHVKEELPKEPWPMEGPKEPWHLITDW